VVIWSTLDGSVTPGRSQTRATGMEIHPDSLTFTFTQKNTLSCKKNFGSKSFQDVCWPAAQTYVNTYRSRKSLFIDCVVCSDTLKQTLFFHAAFFLCQKRNIWDCLKIVFDIKSKYFNNVHDFCFCKKARIVWPLLKCFALNILLSILLQNYMEETSSH